MTQVDSPQLVDTAYAASYLQCSVKTIKRRCNSGELPAIKFARRWYIRKDRLEQMFDPLSPSTAVAPTGSRVDGPHVSSRMKEQA